MEVAAGKRSQCGMTSYIKTSSSSSTVLPGHDLLLLWKLQNDPSLYDYVRKKRQPISQESHSADKPPYSFLFHFTMTFDRLDMKLMEFIEEQLMMAPLIQAKTDTLLSRYLSIYNFTELCLDAIFKYGDDNTLPREIFKCPSVRVLSLKYNLLGDLPADVGRMANLESLILTNNKLQNKSIPFSLTFCTKLKELKLDNNLLDALPGFLLDMPSLETVHRHGNHNYFKSTFMWYHTDVNERILALPHNDRGPPKPPRSCLRQPFTLQFSAAKTIIASKSNFFANPHVSPPLKDFIADNYKEFVVCGCCQTAKLYCQPGYKVITFKNPYLGNTCVPFQHWTCSQTCALRLEIPAREEQIAAAREQDRQYEDYTRDCQNQYLEKTFLFGRKTKKKTSRLGTLPISLWCSSRRLVNVSASVSSSSSVLRRPSPDCSSSLWSSTISLDGANPDHPCRSSFLCCASCK